MSGRTVSLTPGKRVLFLTKDPDLIRRQLRGELDLRMEDLQASDLMDDINTDAMTPAWACFDYRPEDIARNAYAGITIGKERLFPEGSLMAGSFEVIVSGYRKGVGSSRETAVQAEKWSGIRIAIAASFAPIHARNNISQGVLMGDHEVLRRLQAGEAVPLEEFAKGYDLITRMVVEYGGLFPFTKAYARGEVSLPVPQTGPRPMNVAEKILAAHVVGAEGPVFLRPGDAVCVRVDGGYSHEFTTAQVGYFLEQEYGHDYALADPRKFAVFEDHLIYADGVARMAPFSPKIQVLRDLQKAFQRKTGVQDFSAQGWHLARHLPQRRARAHHRARRLHPGHGQPHVHGRGQRRPCLRGRGHRVLRARQVRVHLRRGAGGDPLRAGRPPGEGRDGQRRDAPHPRPPTPSGRRRSTA